MKVTLSPGPTFHGFCDASACASLDGTSFVAASDEPSLRGANRLKIFRFGHTAPLQRLDLNPFLRCDGTRHDPKHPEADLESAARIGDRIFWIGSHGRNARGKIRPDRQRFFATDWKHGALELVGKPYTLLLDDLQAHLPFLTQIELAPEKGGLSIEALTVAHGTGHQRALWIGFRSPHVENRALVVPLLNPDAMVESGERARFGSHFTLDLGGRGLREMTQIRVKAQKSWLLLAGSADSSGSFALYGWDGVVLHTPQLWLELNAALADLKLKNFAPEAILQRPDGAIFLLSDDGDRLIDGRKNSLLPTPERTFRTVQLHWEKP